MLYKGGKHQRNNDTDHKGTGMVEDRKVWYGLQMTKLKNLG